MKRNRNEEGFTLIEMMVVIVIIGILTTVVVLNVLPDVDKACHLLELRQFTNRTP